MTTTHNETTVTIIGSGSQLAITRAQADQLLDIGTIREACDGSFGLCEGKNFEQVESIVQHGIQYPKLIVLCTNSEGAPEFHTCSPQCSQADIDACRHYDLAKENAEMNGYTGPMLAFDQNDPAAKQLGDILAWL